MTLSIAALGCGDRTATSPPAPGGSEGGESPSEEEAPGAERAVIESCLLRGDAEHLALTVDGLPDGLTVHGLPAEVTILADHTEARVLSPLAFEGRGTVDGVLAHIEEPVTGPIGLLHGAAIRRLAISADGLQATAVLGGSFDVGSVYWTGIAVRTSVECDHLALGAASHRDEGPEGEPTHALLGDQDVALRDGPDGAPLGTLMLQLEASSPLRSVTVTEQRDGWVHVIGRRSHGSFDAWVEAPRVVPFVSSLGPIGTIGGGTGSSCGRSDHPYTYRGPARVREGTVVRAEETGAAWAVVTEEVAAEVGVRPNGEVEIIAIDGLRSERCGSLEFDLAMVAGDAVILPAP
jgi:hypothetical protein